MPAQAHMCLLHADFHPMTDACLGAAVAHSRAHPAPFTTAARDAYMAAVERAMLDDHIREHHRTTRPATPCRPTPDTDHLEQAA